MKQVIKKLLRKIVPEKIRFLFWSFIPKVEIVNVYLLIQEKVIEKLFAIDATFLIRIANINDAERLKKAYNNQTVFNKSILPRLKDSSWVGIIVIDTTNDEIAYVSWVIVRNTEFINEFKIYLKQNQFFLRHGYCVPKYRHRGLHTRMEQERINYCVRNGANEIFIQIGVDNKKGINSVIGNGFIYYQKNYILRIPVFDIYREFYSFIKFPFKRVV